MCSGLHSACHHAACRAWACATLVECGVVGSSSSAAFEQKSRPHALLELYARSLILVLRASVIWSMIAQLGMSCPDLNVSSVKLL